MDYIEIDKKVRLLPLFPYGFCSYLATTLEGNNPYATRLALIGASEDFLEKGEKKHRANLRQGQLLIKQKMQKDNKRICGEPAEERRFRTITQEGIKAMTTAPEFITAEEILAGAGDRDIKEIINCSGLSPSAPLQDHLDKLASTNTAEAQRAYAALLLKAVNEEELTPLAYAAQEAKDTILGHGKYSPNQLYNLWRLSHIYSMFRANNYLTNLDRRPFDTGFAINGIHDERSYETYIAKNGNTIPSITYKALTQWYAANPNFYRITQTEATPGEEAYRNWLRTPTFYDGLEIRRLSQDTDDQSEVMRGSKQTLYTVHTGVAFGRNGNYVCYHGKPGAFKWLKKRETETRDEITNLISHMKTVNPDLPWRDSVDHGLYFCTSHYQFASIFAKTIEKHRKGQQAKSFDTDAPYISLHAVPVNDSGVFQLRLLMLAAPVKALSSIRDALVEWDVGFQYLTHPTYDLTFKNRRVFVGHLMDIQKINNALVDYLNGQRFYITCLPEQRIYYRQIFPDLEIL